MTKKIIKVTCDDNVTFFLKKTDIAKKYGYTAQFVGEILNGKTKKKYLVHNNKVHILEYVADDDTEQNDSLKIKHPTDFFVKFLNETAEKTGDKKDFIKITSLFDKFKESKYYIDNANDMQKYVLSLKKMRYYFETNKEIAPSYKKYFNRLIDGKKVNAYKVLIGYKFKEEINK
jgi:hypothetical protein